MTRWTSEEIDWLEERAGQIPFPELVRNMKRKAKQEGWPERTEHAIICRLHRTGKHALCRHGEWLTLGGAADLLGCPATRVEAWLRQARNTAVLQPRWVGGTRYVERCAWRRLARERPCVLGGFSADALFLLLEDRELAESVATRYRRPQGDWRVRCVETGRIYASCGAAAKAHHVTQACISLAIRKRRTVASLGLTFEALRSAADTPQPLRVRNRTA